MERDDYVEMELIDRTTIPLKVGSTDYRVKLT